MRFRSSLFAASASLALIAGCDESAPPMAASPATAPSPVMSGATAATAAALNGPRTRLSLGVIPFSAEVPPGWQLKPGETGRVVLHGRTPSGEVDVLLGTGPVVKGINLPLLIQQSTKPSSDKHVKNEVTQRDSMTLVKAIAPEVPPNVPVSSDPTLIPIGWVVQCIVSNGQSDYLTYDLTILGLSQDMFDRDEAFLQSIIDSIRYEPAASRPAVP